MTNRKQVAFGAAAGWGLVVLSLCTFDVARADHFAVGAQASVRGTERTTLQARFEWGAHHGLRMARETGLTDKNFQSFDAASGESYFAQSFGSGTMYSLAYEYSLNGRQASRTWFLGAGPSWIRGDAGAIERLYSWSETEQRRVRSDLGYARNSFDAFGLVTYAGCRAKIASSLRLAATVQGLWTHESIVNLEPSPYQLESQAQLSRGYLFDFDGVSLQLGFDLSF